MNTITTTIKMNKVTTIAMDMATATPCFPVVTVKGNAEDTDKLLKAVRKAWDNPAVVICGIKSVEPIENKYEISLDDFINHGHTFADSESRVGYIIRTVKAVEVTAIAMDMATATPCFPVVTVKGNAEDTDKLLKAVRKAWDNPAVVICGVKSTTVTETVIGMTPDKLLHFAKPVENN